MAHDAYFDIAPFATRIDSEEPRTAILRWEEPRRVDRVVARFRGPLPPGGVRLQYWRRYWPETADGPSNTSELGWAPSEDWYTGEWQEADVRVQEHGTCLVITFAPLSAAEFPHLPGRTECFRRTNQLRLLLPGDAPPVDSLRVETLAEWETAELTLRCRAGTLEGVEVVPYNGRVLDWRAQGSEGALRVDMLRRPSDATPDPANDTIITLGRDGPWLSFMPRQAVEYGEIRIPSHQLTVRAQGSSIASADGLSVYDRVHGADEQSLSSALAAMPEPDPLYFALGCPGARQKFRLMPDGELQLPPNYVVRVPASDTGRLARSGELRLRLGLGAGLPRRRRLDGYLPILVSEWTTDRANVTLTAFAAPLVGALDDLPGDASVVCLLGIEIEATQGGQVAITIVTHDGDMPEHLQPEGEFVYARREGGPALRMRVTSRDLGLEHGSAGLALTGNLLAGSRAHATVMVPFIALEGPEELAALAALEFNTALASVTKYWRARTAQRARLVTPEQHFNDFHSAHISHVLITDDREVGSDRIHTRVGSFNYGNFSNEACMIISCLDRQGLHSDARHRLDTFIHYQGTVPLPGNYGSHEGVFYGSGGYECGGYNQHHGWVLWALGEHYRLTRDDSWLRGTAKAMIAGAEWVLRERQATCRMDGAGNRVPEWGLLPAGSLEDVTDYHYWLSTNAFSYLGVWSVADALQSGGHPEAERLVGAAEAYRKDIERAFLQQSALSPVVRLRDGSWVPHFPSRLYLRGRDLGWIRETLEGAIHLICTGVIPPQSDVATWILKDYEDNRYTRAPYGYHIPEERFEQDWFSRGGFSMQPNLLWGPVAYLLRDEVKHFLRALYNGFASAFRADVRMLTEHPLPELGCNMGDHFKTSDEAQALHWLRMSLLREDGDELWLGQAVPRAWMASATPIEVEGYATWFGPVSYLLTFRKGRTVMELSPPSRNAPSRLRVRLRHPEGRPLVRVYLDGKTLDCAEPARELVTIPCPTHSVAIEGCFE